MKAKKILALALTVLTAALVLALCIAVLALYGDGVARRAASGSATEPIFTWDAAARMAARLLPLLGLWLALAVFAVVFGVPALKGKGKPYIPPAGPMKGRRETAGRVSLRAILFVLGAALIAAGVINGGLNDVLVKAVNICTECIGLG